MAVWTEGLGVCIEYWEREFAFHADINNPRWESVGRFTSTVCDEWVGGLWGAYAWKEM